VVVAASQGGISALQTVLGRLPADLPTAVAIVQHRTSALPNRLAEVLGRATDWRVKLAEEGETPLCGTVYLASPTRHLAIARDGTFQLVDGRRIHHLTSSANPLFQSAARSFGANVVAVVLTGRDSDATEGVQAVAAAGVMVLVEDPESAFVPGMPDSALRTGAVDRVLTLPEIADAIVELTSPWKETQGNSFS
jgi:two-component system chemotaxis response regulator CheB